MANKVIFWKILFWWLLVVFPFGQTIAFNISGFFPYVRVQPIDISAFMFVLYWLFFQKKNKPPLYLKPMFFFWLAAGLSLLINISSLKFYDFITAFLYLLRLGNWILFFWAVFDFYTVFKINIKNILVVEGLVLAVFSIVQYVLLPDTRFLYYSGWDDHLFRAIGTFLDPGFNGLLIVLSLIISLNMFLENKKNLYKLFFLSTSLVSLIAIGLTFSRMSYLLSIIVCLLTLVVRKKFKLLFLLLIFFLSMIVIFPKPTGEGVDLLRKSTSLAKLKNYEQVLSMVKDNLVFGVGFNNLRIEMKERGFLSLEDWQTSHSGAGADNSLLFVLATTGIIGLIAYLNIWWVVLRKNNDLILRSTSICLLVSAFFVNSLFYPWVLCWWGIVLADSTAEK